MLGIKVELLFAFLLLSLSGNPAFLDNPFVKEMWVVLFLYFSYDAIINNPIDIWVPVCKFLSVIVFVFLVQVILLDNISAPAYFGFCMRACIGYFLIIKLKNNFEEIMFEAIYIISIVSLLFYAIQIISPVALSFGLPYVNTQGMKAFGFFTYLLYDPYRNSGIFWEPGAFAGYINFVILLNLYNLDKIIKNKLKSFIVVLVALVTTFSTAGYSVFFFLSILYFYQNTKLNSATKISGFVVMLALAFIAWNEFDFIGQKIADQFYGAIDIDANKFSNSRFGQTIIDSYYIEKRPFFGGGFNELTRFDDHPILFNEEGDLGYGNGFTTMLATLGFLGFGWILYCFFIFGRRKSNFYGVVWIFIASLLLFGEQFLNYPFLLGCLIYSFHVNKKYTIRKLS